MTSAHFRFSPDILRRLGEELNPSPSQGIIELVKNAHDADAIHCRVVLKGTSNPGGTVTVTDDGSGMSLKEIQDGWLVLGRSLKDSSAPTRLGRLPAGSKGLGRLAALRLGDSVTMRTRSSTSKHLHELAIDWSDFNGVDVVDNVELEIRARPLKGPAKPGTTITLHNLRTDLGRMEVKRLARALILLADPFGDNPIGFQPTLEAPEFDDLAKVVAGRYFDAADFHLNALLDEQGIATATVTDWKGGVLFQGDHKEIRRKKAKEPYACPPATFDLWNYLLAKDAFVGRSAQLGDVREWLGALGGVHVYHNGLRVAPYGDAGNDWLDMNLRRAGSPEERPSTNNSIGRISIAHTGTLLQQKTDRSGFIEGPVFDEVRTFSREALDWMARRRLEAAEQRRGNERKESPKRAEVAREEIAKIIETLPRRRRKKLEHAFGQYSRTQEREVRRLENDVQLYRTLSTAGITAATFAHESSGNPIKVISASIGTIERRTSNLDDYETVLKRPVERIKRAVRALGVLGAATLQLLQSDKRRLTRVDLHSVLRELIDTFAPFTEGRDVELVADLAEGNPFLRGSQAAVESLVTNLLNNSLVAFEHADVQQRRIVMRTRIHDRRITLSVLDNGPGIRGLSLREIWLPGQTTYPHGTGLGLTIVRDTARDLGGDVRAVENGELGGAEISVDLPILGS